MVPNNNQQFGPTDTTNFSIEKPSGNHGYRMIFITVIVVLIAIGGFWISRNENLQQVIKNTIPSSNVPEADSNRSSYVAPVASTIANREIPWVDIVQSDTGMPTLNQPTTFTVRASSGGKDIAGYDILLAIDPNLFEIQSITSAFPSFSILQFERGTHITVNGLKDIGKNDPVILNETALITVTVKPIKKGKTTVSVLLQQDLEKTMLVDTEVTPITPQVGSLEIEVK